MSDIGTASVLRRRGEWSGPALQVLLTYDERLLRRKRLTTATGDSFLVDLPQTVSLDQGDALELADGRRIAVQAAHEPLLAVRGNLVRLAWHIGNRHAPCQIDGDRLLLIRDKVLRGMLEGLGASVTETLAPFTPEGGAYGTGRVMGHAPGPDSSAPWHGHAG